MSTVQAHPVATLGQLFFPPANAGVAALLASPDLELSYNARGALLQVSLELGAASGDAVLVPAYHLPSGVMPQIEAGLRPVFCRNRGDLSLALSPLRAKVWQHTLPINVIHVADFDVESPPLQVLRARRNPPIEDWLHPSRPSNSVHLPVMQNDFPVLTY